ncbi:hypothetical protein IFR05_005404 [Cadophora sp. M221]|nr:hypothetical protein IFR05_005404 [Cadophora sp. M221]
MLISPTNTPRDLLPESHIAAMSMEWKLQDTPDLTWEMIEKYDRKLLEDLENAYIVHNEKLAKAGAEWRDVWYANPSTWTIKKITYMQAVSASVARSAAGI